MLSVFHATFLLKNYLDCTFRCVVVIYEILQLNLIATTVNEFGSNSRSDVIQLASRFFVAVAHFII